MDCKETFLKYNCKIYSFLGLLLLLLPVLFIFFRKYKNNNIQINNRKIKII